MAEGTSPNTNGRAYSRSLHQSSVEDSKRYQNSRRRFNNQNICHFYLQGICRYGAECRRSHDFVKTDAKFTLQRDKIQAAKFSRRHDDGFYPPSKELECDMELSFAIQRSLDKKCGICLDVILEKNPLSERRFGLLKNCNHIFCLSCIRQWRKINCFERNHEDALDAVVKRACPECRVWSDFIIPSKYWPETAEGKNKLIEDYKLTLSRKPCKYFKQGFGKCPFGRACFYLHSVVKRAGPESRNSPNFITPSQYWLETEAVNNPTTSEEDQRQEISDTANLKEVLVNLKELLVHLKEILPLCRDLIRMFGGANNLSKMLREIKEIEDPLEKILTMCKYLTESP